MTDVRGIVPPLLTPFDEDGSIAEQRLRDHVDFLIDAGVHGLFPGASIGELSNLNTDELERVTTLVVEQAAGEVPVYAGVGASGTLEAVERTKRADAAGADVLIAITPYFLETDQAGLYDHYTRIADATDLPILLYHLPSMTGQTLDVDTVSELATDVDTVVGLKDSSGDLTWGSRVVANTPDDFAYLQGLGSLLLPSLVLGADGGVTGTANVAPDPLLAVYDAYRDGELDRARSVQVEEVTPLANALMGGTFPAGFKEAARLAGRDLGVPRPPVQGFSEAERASLRDTMDSLGHLAPDR
ncbi:dihydrodipicolinate synthase family protein [Haloplanus litoreus]|uniref:Dihydrodipicolinate synthase family protein n=1 Tax=Haloplanus litoreus TaxID=767515 RepID=A0ABD6A181_9EURY